MISSRLTALRTLLSERGLDGMVIQKEENRRYFSGFSGTSGWLAVSSSEGQLLITDFRYMEQAKRQAPDFETVKHGTDAHAAIADSLSRLGIHKAGFEGDGVTWDEFASFQKAAPTVEWTSVHLDYLRMVKDQAELALITTACEIADKAFADILRFIRPGVTEWEIAVELESSMRRHGSQKPAFDTIVAAGLNGALPHAMPSKTVVQSGDFITMDFGAVYDGYHSDITRTVVAGHADARQRELYDLVLKAQLAGLDAVKPGRKGSEVDQVARDLIRRAGYGEAFGHGLGHGVGLVIHEEPRLSTSGGILLAEGMVVTVEPGVYLPGWGGLRIEDTVVVNADGGKRLTASSKELIEIDWQ